MGSTSCQLISCKKTVKNDKQCKRCNQLHPNLLCQRGSCGASRHLWPRLWIVQGSTPARVAGRWPGDHSSTAQFPWWSVSCFRFPEVVRHWKILKVKLYWITSMVSISKKNIERYLGFPQLWWLLYLNWVDNSLFPVTDSPVPKRYDIHSYWGVSRRCLNELKVKISKTVWLHQHV